MLARTNQQKEEYLNQLQPSKSTWSGKIAIAALLACASTFPGAAKPAAAQAAAESDQRSLPQLAGSWLTSYQVAGFTSKVPVLLTFHEDHTVLESDSPTPNPLFNPPVALSNGQGVWAAAQGVRDYSFYYRKLIFEETASTPSGSTATTGRVSLSADGQTFQAGIEIVFFDADNKITSQTSGSVTGTRITLPKIGN